MPQTQNKILPFLGVGILIFVIVLVRAFESELFYDPFLEFFKGDYLNAKYPDYNLPKLLASTAARFWINSIITIAIIRLLFHESFNFKFVGLIFVSAFVLFAILFAIVLQFGDSQHMVFFYVRRFLIQPILLLLLVPAFYYQKVTVKS